LLVKQAVSEAFDLALLEDTEVDLLQFLLIVVLDLVLFEAECLMFLLVEVVVVNVLAERARLPLLRPYPLDLDIVEIGQEIFSFLAHHRVMIEPLFLHDLPSFVERLQGYV